MGHQTSKFLVEKNSNCKVPQEGALYYQISLRRPAKWAQWETWLQMLLGYELVAFLPPLNMKSQEFTLVTFVGFEKSNRFLKARCFLFS